LTNRNKNSRLIIDKLFFGKPKPAVMSIFKQAEVEAADRARQQVCRVFLAQSSVQLGVQLTEDIVEAIDAEVVYLATFPAVLATRISQLLVRESIQTVRCAFHNFRLTPTTKYKNTTSTLHFNNPLHNISNLLITQLNE